MAIALAGTCDPALDNLPLEVLGLPGDISINEQSRDGVCDAVGAANTHPPYRFYARDAVRGAVLGAFYVFACRSRALNDIRGSLGHKLDRSG